jgi:hypothetical protein
MAGGAHDPLKIFRAAMGASGFNGFILAQKKQFKAIIAFEAFEFIDWHCKSFSCLVITGFGRFPTERFVPVNVS